MGRNQACLEHFACTMVGGRVGASLACGMDGGVSRLARNTFFVRRWSVGGLGSSMTIGMNGGMSRLARNFVRTVVERGRGGVFNSINAFPLCQHAFKGQHAWLAGLAGGLGWLDGWLAG